MLNIEWQINCPKLSYGTFTKTMHVPAYKFLILTALQRVQYYSRHIMI